MSTPISAGPKDAVPLTIDVDLRQAVFAGAVAVRVDRGAQQLDIVLAGGPQSDVAGDARMTAALLALARETLPNAAVEALPILAGSTNPRGMIRASGAPGMIRPSDAPGMIRPSDAPGMIRPSDAPSVRIRLPLPATDEAVRDSISRILAAVNSRRYGDDTSGARVISLDHVFAGCTPFDAPAREAAQTRVAQLALVIGAPLPTGLSLRTISAARPFEAPAAGMPHCTRGTSIFPDASLPSSASYRDRHVFAFAQPIRFAAASASPPHEVRALWSGPTEGPRLRLRAPGVLLSVEGYAARERHPLGTLYVYDGPNGPWSLGDLTLESIDTIRRRLRAAGVADSAMATQLSPNDGVPYVQVFSPDPRRNAAIVAAIGGSAESERAAVETTTVGDTCADEQRALARAVADARARAARISTGLGASIDTAPVAVRIGAGIGFAPCADRGMEETAPDLPAEHIAGELPRRELDSTEAVTVSAVFRIGYPQLSGAVRSQRANDEPTSITARFGYVAPPFDYPEAMHEGSAELQAQLPPQRVRVDLTLSPDNRHGFHAIDRSLAAGLAATLGASAAQFTAAFVPDRAPGTGRPTPDQMIFEAEFPNHGSATEHALDAALASAQAAGYGGFSIVPETDGCAAVDDALALDAIRAAARNPLPSERAGHVVAIDLRGPFTVDGLCRPTSSGVATWAIRNATIKDVRLGAYARVSYSRSAGKATRNE